MVYLYMIISCMNCKIIVGLDIRAVYLDIYLVGQGLIQTKSSMLVKNTGFPIHLNGGIAY